MRAVLALALFTIACKGSTKAPPAPTGTDPGSAVVVPQDAPPRLAHDGPDPSSDSNPHQVAVTHIALDLSVDFATRALTGTAKLTLKHLVPGSPLRLDIGWLAINKVTECTNDQVIDSKFSKSTLTSPPGQTLEIVVGDRTCIAISYKTPAEAAALLWLDPQLTAGKKQPMLFTQSQPTLARTWLPVQDTPSVRATYEATIRVKAGLVALMSATNPQEAVADGVYRFVQDKPIPSYLMALAVGDFKFAPLGKRSGVYAEPSVVKAAAFEFAEVEKMMDAAEKLYGPYRWDRYDILVLPPSFPFGGMENPRLSFLTPTVLTGDRALVSLLAHELAHSWSGNLVTNSTWNDVWLNEGFTTYVERRIMEELRGREIADMGWAFGRMDLDEIVANKTNDSRLALTYKVGEDPDTAPSDVAYEKGALFLRALEEAIGRQPFDTWLRERFDRLAFQSTDSAAFEKDIASLFALATPTPPWTVAQWLHERGLPTGAPASASVRVAALKPQAEAFARAGTLPDARAWQSNEWIAFLRQLPRTTPRAHLEALDKKFALTKTTNMMVAMRWFELAIAADMREAAPFIQQYLVSIGRRWLVRSIYEALITKGGFWRELAATSFDQAKAGYHTLTRDTIAQMLTPTVVPPPEK